MFEKITASLEGTRIKGAYDKTTNFLLRNKRKKAALDAEKMKGVLENAANILLAASESEYGESYRKDYLTMYRDFVASADNISSRREKANGIFLGINTSFIGASAYFEMNSVQAVYIQAIVGLMFCLVWGRMIESYKSLNSSKFQVIHLMERNLPLAPLDAEYVIQKDSPKKHRSLSTIEQLVPGVFAVLHILATIFLIGLKD